MTKNFETYLNSDQKLIFYSLFLLLRHFNTRTCFFSLPVAYIFKLLYYKFSAKKTYFKDIMKSTLRMGFDLIIEILTSE